MKTKTLFLTLAFALLGGANVIRADDKEDLDRSIAALDATAKNPSDSARVLERISKDTGVPVATLEQQKTKSGLGYGELFIANRLADSTGKSFDQLLAEHQAGKGWGEIAKDNNVKLGRIVSAARKSEKALAKESGKSRPADSGSFNSRRDHRNLDHPLPSDVGHGPHGHGGGKK